MTACFVPMPRRTHSFKNGIKAITNPSDCDASAENSTKRKRKTVCSFNEATKKEEYMSTKMLRRDTLQPCRLHGASAKNYLTNSRVKKLRMKAIFNHRAVVYFQGANFTK